MRGKRAKRLRRMVAEREIIVVPFDRRHIRVGRAYGGPALGQFPYPPSRREGDHFDVINNIDLETIRQEVLSYDTAETGQVSEQS